MTAQTAEIADELTASLTARAKRDPMPLLEADGLLGIRKGSIAAAERRGEIRTLRKPGGKLRRVTCRSLANWVAEYWTEG